MSFIGNQPADKLITASDLDPAFSMPYGQVSNTTLPYAITNLLYPSKDGKWRDTYRAGWLPWSFNQQWGGTFGGQIINGATGALVEGDFLTGNIEDNSGAAFGNAAGYYYMTSGFKVSRTVTNPTIWVKLYKVGNPTTLTVSVRADSAGSPTGADLGTATISGKLVTSKSDGEWYAFTPTVGSLTAGTQYHLVLTQSTTDASNYFNGKQTTTKKYPHGYINTGTSVPAWTPATGNALCFLIQAPAASAFLQSSGQFDSKFVFSGAGSTLDQSDALVQPLRNFWDGKQFTDIIRGKSWTVSQPVRDYQYGIDHDRILVSITASGYAQLDVWDSGGTKRTVTGTTNISGATHSDIAVSIRSAGDGSDYIKLYVNGTSEGTPLTSLTLSFDPMFRELGHATLGGANAFSVPTWTNNAMTTNTLLPSNAANGSWAWTGTGTEANCMSMQGGKLFQNKNGYGAADSGYYLKATAGLSNANGWIAECKMRVSSSTNTPGSACATLRIEDGTKVFLLEVFEYFVQTVSSAVDFTVQGDFKSQEHVFTVIGKGSDYYLFIDGKLAVDGTGKLTGAIATNQVLFGDLAVASGENADAIWSYVKYYTTAAVLPQFTSGSLSEYAHFSGDRTAILPSLYNSGTPVSVKSYAGVERNYVASVVQTDKRIGVTNGPTTTSGTMVLLPEMEMFAIGSEFDMDFSNLVLAPSSAAMWQSFSLDGSYEFTGAGSGNLIGTGSDNGASANYKTAGAKCSAKVPVGLHKVEVKWYTGAGTAYSGYKSRNLNVESKP